MKILINKIALLGLLCTCMSLFGQDLRLLSFYVPMKYAAGYAAPCSVTVWNTGTTTTPASTVSFYLSTDSAFSASDTYLGNVAIPSLTPSNNESRTLVNVTMPNLSGKYYIVATVDPNNVFAETDESNNTKIYGLLLGPPVTDLAIKENGVDTNPGYVAGEMIDASCQVYNPGNLTVPFASVGFYLSKDEILDANDTNLDTANITKIYPEYKGYGNFEYFRSYHSAFGRFRLPLNLTPGQYYIIMKVDDRKLIAETNENNNTYNFPFTVKGIHTVSIPTSGNVTLTTCNGEVYDGGGIAGDYPNNSNGSVTIYPEGAGNYVGLTFKTFSLESDGDYLAIYDGTSTSAKFLGKFTSMPNGTLYASDPSGALTLRLFSNSSKASEGFSAAVSCVRFAYLPDLIPALGPSPSFSSTFIAGGPVEFNVNVANGNRYNGSSETLTYADSSTVSVYLTSDSLSSNYNTMYDYFVGIYNVPTIFGNGFIYKYTYGRIPQNMPSGRYFVKIVVDSQGKVKESNEFNNVYVNNYSSIKIIQDPYRSDLTLRDLKLPMPIVGVGGQLQLSVQEHNVGNVGAGAHEIGYYLSLNNTFEGDDLLIGTTSVIGLNTGDSTKAIQSFVISKTVAPGKYYLIARANHKSSITELSSTNNDISLPVTVLPWAVDFSIKSLSVANATAPLGDAQFKYILTEQSTGVGNAPVHNVRFWMSKDTVLDKGDAALNTASMNSYAARSEGTLTGTVSLPTGTALGFYYIIAHTNYDSTVQEMDKFNNIKAVKVSVVAPKYDLQIKSMSVTTPNIMQGDKLSVNMEEYNASDIGVGEHVVQLFVSTDSIFDISDKQINSITIGGLFKGGTMYSTLLGSVPHIFAKGSYYALVVLDAKKVVAEINEANNTRALPFTIASNSDIDLMALGSFPDNSKSYKILQNTTFAALFEVKNVGTTKAYESKLDVFLSKDSVYSQEDTLLGYFTVYELSPNTSTNKSQVNLNIPHKIAPGEYFLLGVADSKNVFLEKNRGNNTAVLRLTLEEAFTDFNITSLKTTTSKVSNFVEVNTTIANFGSVQSNSNALGYYLSKDSVQSADDVLLGSSTVYVYNTATVSSKLEIPASVALGTYYLIGKADYNNQFAEKNEGNNTKAVKLEIVVPTVDFSLSLKLVNKWHTAGKPVALKFDLTNSGSTSVPTVVLGYYLSTDSVFTADDIAIGTSSLSGSSLGTTQYANYSTLNIPQATVEGNYYLIAMVDHDNKIVETNETNNYSSCPFQIVKSIPDFAISSLQSFNAFFRNKSSTLSTNFVNLGFGTASISFNYYLSKDSLLDAQDLLLNGPTPATSSGSNNPYYASVLIPTSADLGTHYVIVVIDGDNKVLELDETNNAKALRINIQDPVVDLEVKSVVVNPQTAIAGNRVVVTSLFTNIGNFQSIGRYTRLYFSKDSIYDANDIFMDSAVVNPIIGKGQYSIESSLRVPLNTAPGTYYIIQRLGTSTVDFNPTNDTKAAALTIGVSTVDLALSGLSINLQTVAPGGTFVVNSSIKSTGSGWAKDLRIGYYLSKDTIYDVQDVFIKTDSYGDMQPNYDNYYSSSFTVPSAASVGANYIIARIDPDNNISETNENNNSRWVRFDALGTGTDITLTIPNRVKWVEPNKSFLFGYYIENLGTVSVPYNTFNMAFYLSKDSVFDAKDLFLTTRYNGGAIGAGAKSYNSWSFTIPDTVSTGNYYIVIIADYENKIVEFNENNNTKAHALLVSRLDVDLVIDSLSVSKVELTTNDYIPLTFVIRNSGTTAVVASTAEIHLSKDSTYDSSDKYIQSINVSALEAKGIYRSSLLIWLNGLNLPAGDYYVICRLDAANVVPENNENNNGKYTKKFKITIRDADLSIATLTTPDPKWAAGSSASVTYTETNLGSVSIYSYNMYYYLSADSVYDSNDRQLSYYTSIFYGSPTRTGKYSVNIPADVAKGAYYFILVQDRDNKESESNKNNNTKAIPVFVGLSGTDLAIKTLELSKNSVNTSTHMRVKVEEVNSNNSNAITHDIGYVLSLDSIKSADDLLLRNTNVSALDGNSSRTLVDSVYIPNGIANGKYYLIAVTDYYGVVAETNESNNHKAVLIEVSTLACDLNIFQVAFKNAAQGLGYALTADVRFQNSSQNQVGSHYEAFFLSKDTVFDSKDSLIGYSYLSGLKANGSAALNVPLKIPATAVNGGYYLISIADYFKVIQEINEANNQKAIKIIAPVVTNIGAETLTSSNIGLYPNPTTGMVYLFNIEGNVPAEVYDLEGRLLFTQQVSKSLDLGALPQGVYIVKLRKDDTYVQVQRVVVSK